MTTVRKPRDGAVPDPYGPSAMTARLGRTALLGRGDEIHALRALVDELTAGNGSVAVIEGEAGIGKTRLLDDIVVYAKSVGVAVVRGDADELGRDRPFGVIADALGLEPGSDDAARAELGQWIEGVVPAERSSGAAVDVGFRIVDAIISLVEELGSNTPAVIVLDDLQWADPSTLRAVRALSRRLDELPVTLLFALRTHPRTAEVDGVIDEVRRHRGLHLRLGPLDTSEMATLTSDLVNAEPGPRLMAQLAGAGGNPLFVIELINALSDEGGIDVRDGTAEVATVTVPASLRATILRRLRGLDADTLDLLKVASVLGSTFSSADLATVTGRTVVELLSVLTDAVQAGFVGERGERLAFRHDVIREAIYGDVPQPIRRDLHRHAASALGAAGAPAERVAEHVSLGASAGDSFAVQSLHLAARDIAPRSSSVAANLLQRALAIADDRDPLRLPVTSDLAFALYSTGRLEEAEAVVRDVLDRELTEPERRHTHRSLGAILFLRGDRSAARDLFDLNAATDEPAFERAFDMAAAALASPYIGDLDGAWTRAEEAVRLGEQCFNAHALSLAFGAWSLVARYRGLLPQAIDFGRRALQGVDVIEWGTWLSAHLGSTYTLAAANLEADDLEQADAAFRTGRRANEDGGDVWQCSLHVMGLATKHFMAGEWDDAAAEATACLSLAAQTETTFAVVIFTHALLAAIDIPRGEISHAEATLAVAEEEFAANGPQFGVDAMLWVRAGLLESRGDIQAAAATLAAAWDLFGTFGYTFTHRSIATDLVRLALVTGDRPLALTVTKDMEVLAERARVPTAEGAALRCRGLLDDNVDALLRSVETYRRGPRPFDLALACEDAAIALGRVGDLVSAVRLFDEAQIIFGRLGAIRNIKRADATLRELGVRRRRHHATPRPATGWESLTETELRVSRLVAEGLTNRQIADQLFISRRTVETHTAHVFRKLGVSNRTELAAQVVRQLR